MKFNISYKYLIDDGNVIALIKHSHLRTDFELLLVLHEEYCIFVNSKFVF